MGQTEHDVRIDGETAEITTTVQLHSPNPGEKVNFWDVSVGVTEGAEVTSIEDTHGAIKDYRVREDELTFETNTGLGRETETVEIEYVVEGILVNKISGLRTAEVIWGTEFGWMSLDTGLNRFREGLRRVTQTSIRNTRVYGLTCRGGDAFGFLFLSYRGTLHIVVGRSYEFVCENLMYLTWCLVCAVFDSVRDEVERLVNASLRCDINGLRDAYSTVLEGDRLLTWACVFDSVDEYLDGVLSCASVYLLEGIAYDTQCLFFLSCVFT